MWCDFWNHWVQMKCRLSHQLTHINMFFISSVLSVVLFLLSAQNPARQQSLQGACVSVCSHFYESLCVYVQLPDPRSPVRLLWILRVLDFWSGFFQGGGVWVSISPGSLRQLRGSVSGCGRRLRGSLFQLSACYCATICGEWKGARPQLGYSSKGDSWDKVRGEMCKCASMCERGVRMTTHRHTPLVLPSVRKWDARLWESRARHFSFYVWWGERSEEETVNGVIVTPAAFPRLFRVSE